MVKSRHTHANYERPKSSTSVAGGVQGLKTVKPREPRRKVFISARMRCDGRWSDVRVLDAASRGFLIHAHQPPQRGTYVELGRGPRTFVARVVWSHHQRFGVRTQDRIDVDAFIDSPSSKQLARARRSDTAAIERRSANRRREGVRERLAHSQARARTLEYFSIVAVSGIAATAFMELVQQIFAGPVAAVSSALAH